MTLFRKDAIQLLLAMIILLAGCSVYEETVPSAENITPIAWDLFEEGDYAEAYAKFDDAVEIDSKNQEAYHGRAWSALLLSDVQDAIDDFKAAIYYDNTDLDPLAGLVFAYHAKQEYTAAISKAKTVLSANPYYYFEHKPLINYRDIRLILAAAYFHTGDLEEAYDEITTLDPTISFTQIEESTYLFNDQTYDSYAGLLLAVIDYLDVLYGM